MATGLEGIAGGTVTLERGSSRSLGMIWSLDGWAVLHHDRWRLKEYSEPSSSANRSKVKADSEFIVGQSPAEK